MNELFKMTSSGIYIPEADVYIDPWQPVERSIITHGHSDHARGGNKYYLCHHLSMPVLKYRLGADINVESIGFKEGVFINGVKFSLHPAGHIPGSAQIRIEKNGNVLVVSGDYKIENDFISTEFEVIKCNTFITESTFGLPIFKWKNQQTIFDGINNWWQINIENNKTSILAGYALGKIQRVLKNIDINIGKIYAHGAVYNMNEILRTAGIDIPFVQRLTSETLRLEYKNALILAPTSVVSSPWLKKFDPYSIGYCSGWMQVRGNKRRQGIDRGFVVSDHADWYQLNETIRATGAVRIYVTHGYTDAYVRWLHEEGFDARELKTEFVGETLLQSDDTNTDADILTTEP